MVPALQRIAAPMDRDWMWECVAAAERAGAALALLTAAPLLGIAAVTLSLLSFRRPFIAHLRVGRYGAPLWAFKLRTMWPATSSEGFCRGLVEYIVDDRGPCLKNRSDPRVSSRFARFCRRYSIDELPQLVNIVGGQMSFVGPRPLTAGELKEHYGEARREVLRIRPGLTGLWQCSGRGRLSYQERRTLDIQYARMRSLPLYFKILLRTVPTVLRGNNSW